MAKKNSGWWDDFFPTFRPVFGIIPQRVTNAQARYIVKKLALRPGKRFLDCPCGIGRIAIPLAKQGIKVTGVDIIQSYLDELETRAKRLKLKIDLVHRDMRRISYDSQFDAGGNIWTSFGFFEKESDNLLVLKKMFRALKPGGKFLLHVINRDWIITNYASRDWWYIKNTRGHSVAKVVDERHFDYRTSINHGNWHFIKDGRETSHQILIRMYSYHELVGMFEQVGFTDIEGYGSVKDEPISREKQMMFIIGTRPKRR